MKTRKVLKEKIRKLIVDTYYRNNLSYFVNPALRDPKYEPGIINAIMGLFDQYIAEVIGEDEENTIDSLGVDTEGDREFLITEGKNILRAEQRKRAGL